MRTDRKFIFIILIINNYSENIVNTAIRYYQFFAGMAKL